MQTTDERGHGGGATGVVSGRDPQDDERASRPTPARVAADAAASSGLLTRSPRVQDVMETCTRVAPTDATVLLLGETGTGKERLARLIHENSGRPGPFVAINCGAVPETLIESTLFGHEKGSFTGAEASREGLFRHARGGTLLLDEVGTLPLTAQYTLLRALQERAVRPVGGTEEIPVDVRVVAATSTPLDAAVEQGQFRRDLLYRLDVIRVVIPPLRERPEDIELLFEVFCGRAAEQNHLAAPVIGDTFRDAMLDYDWPGNVRQLENFATRLVVTRPGEALRGEHFDELVRPYRRDEHPAPEAPQGAPRRPRLPEIDVSRTLDEVLEDVVGALERRYLEALLRENAGCMQISADAAGLSRRTLLRKLKKYGLDRRAYTF